MLAALLVGDVPKVSVEDCCMSKSCVRPLPRSEVGRQGLGFRGFWLLAGMFCLIALGCGDSGEIHQTPPSDEAHPVKGKILLNDGKPAESGVVVFNPVTQPGLQARGEIGPDGGFTLTSRTDGDGAIAGEYNVVVVIPPTKKELRRYEKYASEDRPLLKASVKSGSNELTPFRLK